MKKAFVVLVGVLLAMAIFQGAFSEEEVMTKKRCTFPKGGHYVYLSPKKNCYCHGDSVTVSYEHPKPSKAYFCDDGFWTELQ